MRIVCAFACDRTLAADVECLKRVKLAHIRDTDPHAHLCWTLGSDIVVSILPRSKAILHLIKIGSMLDTGTVSVGNTCGEPAETRPKQEVWVLRLQW